MDCAGYPVCSIELSDPRVSGDVWFDFDVDSMDSVSWGRLTIGGPDGDWNGPFVTYWNEDLEGLVTLFTLEGTDAYEGWAFVATWMARGSEPTHAVTGRVYQGPAPRMEWPGIASYPGTREPSPSPASE